jgi:hypothetical protein
MITTTLQDIKAPELLRECRGWLVWRSEVNKGNAKPLKVPYYVNGKRRSGVNGSPDDVAQMADFDTAVRYAKENNFTGVGFAFLPEFCVTGLDFDNCIIDGIINPEVEKVTLGTYTEISPSGKGIHAWVRGNLGDRKSGTDGNAFGFELFSTKIWLTFTGKTTELCELTGATDTIADPNEDLALLIMNRFGSEPSIRSFLISSPDKLGVTFDTIKSALNVLPNDLSYDEWLQIGMAIHHESEGSEEGFIIWDSWSANSPKYSSEDYGRYKWESFGCNTSSRPVTVRSLLKKANSMGASIAIPDEVITKDDFEPILDITERDNPTELKSFFNIRTAADFMANVKPISWLIKGFLPKATLGVLYGESGSGKSFVAMDICAALARQVDWNGIRCQSQARRVLYVVAEGVGGFSVRLSAYCHKTGISANDLHVDIISDVVPNLTDGVSVDRLIRDIHQRQAYDLIVMDTFAQVTPGANENSGEDMGRALGYCRKISQSSGAMVLLVHHSGKDASKGARGWSGVHAASDVVFEISRFDEERCIKVTKQKDGSDGAEYGFRLVPVWLGEDEDGDDITSCVVEYKEFVKPVKVPELKTNQKIVYSVLSEFSPEAWTTESNVIELCVEKIPKEEGVRDIRRQNIKKAINSGIGHFIQQNDSGEIRLAR